MGTVWTLQSSFPGLSLYSKQPLAFGTSYYAISLGLNIVLTGLILVRLLLYRRTHLAHLPSGHAQQYLTLATLIVESAALYSIFAIMFLVSYAMNKPINQVWLGFAQAAQVPRFFHPPHSALLTRPFAANRDVHDYLPRRERDRLVQGGDGNANVHREHTFARQDGFLGSPQECHAGCPVHDGVLGDAGCFRVQERERGTRIDGSDTVLIMTL